MTAGNTKKRPTLVETQHIESPVLTVLNRKMNFTKTQPLKISKLLARWIAFMLILMIQPAWGQHEIQPTDEFMIVGQVEQEVTFKISDIGKFDIKPIKDIQITNHAGERKGAITGLKGILIKDILAQATIKVDNPKQLSECFLTFVASDGYKIVYSWNEIFNTATGDHTFLLTEMDGKPVEEMSQRIVMISSSDYRTGSRNLKGLYKIIVERIE